VRESVLLEGCVAEMGAQVSRSILAGGARVAPGAALDGAVVGSDERVPG
jgi:ADP-glucose pyrophosphorylase